MNARRGLQDRERGRGPPARRSSGGGGCEKTALAAFGPLGCPYIPTTFPPPAPHLQLCLLEPARRCPGSEDPWSPHCALQIPRNVKLGGGGVRGRKDRSWEPPIPLET